MHDSCTTKNERIEFTVMSAARNPVPTVKPTTETVVKKLREHLDDAKAEMLARRIETADEDARHAVDWQDVKRRALLQKPML